MASCGAYDCPKCGGLVIIGPPETVDHYGGPHVCKPTRIAEKRYLENPRAEFPDEVLAGPHRAA